MNTIRVAMTVYLLAVLMFVFLGWRWVDLKTQANPPPKNLTGARVVLVVSGIASLVGLGLIWSAKPRRSH